MMTIGDYPTDTTLGANVLTVINQPVEYKFEKYMFEDGACVVNVQPCGIQRWELYYDGLTQAQRDTLTDHYNSAMGKVNSFSFTHPRSGTTYTGVQYEGIDIQHHTKRWSLGIKVTLVKLL